MKAWFEMLNICKSKYSNSGATMGETTLASQLLGLRQIHKVLLLCLHNTVPAAVLRMCRNLLQSF